MGCGVWAGGRLPGPAAAGRVRDAGGTQVACLTQGVLPTAQPCCCRAHLPNCSTFLLQVYTSALAQKNLIENTMGKVG